MSDPEPPGDGRGADDPPPLRELHPLRLPFGIRLGLFALGWLLILVGIAGLFLPVIQGWLTLFLGVAVLSLVSELAYELLRKALSRWPRIWAKIERFRERAHGKLRRFHRE